MKKCGVTVLLLLTVAVDGRAEPPGMAISNSPYFSDRVQPLYGATVSSFNEAVESGLIADILYKVISREGKSKNYTDIIPLDGGTVGIAHFAVGGLADLYRLIDTDKYFKKPRSEMIRKYSSSCRPSGRKGNDTGWGCYSKSWWKEGMTKFLNSPESKQVQDSAWSSKMKPVVERAISEGWNTPRMIAIALGIANSVGKGGFNALAANSHWSAEKTLKAYVGDDMHRHRREVAIDMHFPK